MGGQAAQRGFLLQTLVCILDAVSENNDWIELTIEPNLESEKVDILFIYSEFKKVTQVKSSQNQITVPKATAWADDLKKSFSADKYELLLIGPTSQGIINNPIINEVSIPTPKVLDILALIEQASHKLDKYLNSRGYLPIPPFIREEFVSSLITKLSIYSTSGIPISKNDFDKLLQEWIIMIYPSAVSESINMQTVLLLDTIIFLGGQGPEIPIILPLNLINDGLRTAVVEWISFKVVNKDMTKLYTPIALIDYEKFIQGKRVVHAENIISNYTQIAVGQKQTKEITVAFSQEIGNQTIAPSIWIPGKYDFNIYVKYRDCSFPKLECILHDVEINQELLSRNQSGETSVFMVRNIKFD